MKNPPKVSIIIITYNQEIFIRDAILSTINQDYQNIEIIISDDNSQDSTPEIIMEFANKYPGIIIPILNDFNIGITGNCNRGLKACGGEYVALLGGDDIMLPGKITAQVNWFRDNQNGVLCGTLCEDINADGTKSVYQTPLNPKAYGTGPLNFIRRVNCISGQTLMVKSSAIPNHGFDESVTVASDNLFCIEVLMSGGTYGCVNGVYGQRRTHNNNVTRNQEMIFLDQDKAYRIIAERYPKYQKECKKAIAEHVYYYQGVHMLRQGGDSLSLFKMTLKVRPLYYKAYIRIIQSLLKKMKIKIMTSFARYYLMMLSMF